MPTIQIEAQLSDKELLKAVEQLSEPKLERFLTRILALRAQRRDSCLSQKESELLLKINHSIPKDVLKRYEALIARRDEETLTRKEHAELLRLTRQVEGAEVERVRHLVELAKLRGVSLEELVEKLGIPSTSNASTTD